MPEVIRLAQLDRDAGVLDSEIAGFGQTQHRLPRSARDRPFGALAAFSACAGWIAGPQHGDVGHHNNAALLGGRDQKFHCDLPMLALGFGRRQREDINASIAEISKSPPSPVGIGSKKWRDQPVCPPSAPGKLLHRISK